MSGQSDREKMLMDRDRAQERCDRRLEAMTQNKELPPDDDGKPATCMAVNCSGKATVGGYCAGHAAGRHSYTTQVIEKQRAEFESGKRRA